jgi:hypothetical protein
MNENMSPVVRLITCCSLVCLACALAACDTGGSGGSILSSIPAGGTTTSFSGTMHLYTGLGVMVKYPSNWTVDVKGNGESEGGATFHDPGTLTTFSLQILPIAFGDSAPADAVNNLIPALKKEGTQTRAVPVASTTTVGGQTWNQAAGTTQLTQGGQSVVIEQVMLATYHPPHSSNARLYVLTYTAPAQTFDQISTSIFQPMLQSLTFTSN